MNFRVGQKVVCVDSAGDPDRVWLRDIPTEGTVYTVHRVLMVSTYNGRHVGLVLEEIKNADVWKNAYRASRFRPVVERKTDISIFTRMLTPAPRVKQPVTPGD